ncbi:ankyrin repeat-containing domain protein, partial [Russula dissimulans]
TPLFAALDREHFGIAKLLIRHGAGATLNVRGILGMSFLHCAAYYGDVKVALFLLEHNGDVNSQSSSQQTPLHFSGRYGGSHVARLLLEHGANINARSKSGRTPLHVAAMYGIVDVARVLVEHGANVDEKDHKDKTASQLALEGGHHEMVTFL